MMPYRWAYLVVGSLLLGQLGTCSALPAQKPAAQADTPATNSGGSQPTSTAKISPDTPVITINGLCDHSDARDSGHSNCKTVITKAEFEKLVAAIQPGMRGRARREFALSYASALVMTKKAEGMKLDQGPNYEEQLKIARIQILAKELTRVMQAEASQISDRDVEDYYQKNISRFEQADIERIYVPKTQQPALSDEPNTDPSAKGNLQTNSQTSEDTMKHEAESLRERALAGEEFSALQADAYRVARIKSATPNTKAKIRRTSLPADQVSVMDLQPGQVSPVITDANGYVLYKMMSKATLTLDQVRQEITATLHAQRLDDEMRKVQDAVTTTFDDDYFRVPLRGVPNAPATQ